MKKFFITVAFILIGSIALSNVALATPPQGGAPLSGTRHVGGWWWQPVRIIGMFLVGEVARGSIDDYGFIALPNGCQEKVKRHFTLWFNYRDRSVIPKLDYETPTGEIICGESAPVRAPGGKGRGSN